jgi:hypothetical protein
MVNPRKTYSSIRPNLELQVQFAPARTKQEQNAGFANEDLDKGFAAASQCGVFGICYALRR